MFVWWEFANCMINKVFEYFHLLYPIQMINKVNEKFHLLYDKQIKKKNKKTKLDVALVN